jgi:Protein involved in formate dehydrogenase formation
MDQLRASLDRRLAHLAAARPDLDRAIELQRILLGRQIDMLDLFRQAGVPAVSLPAGYLGAKLKRSIPALHGEPIPLPSKILELSAREYCDHLSKGGAGAAAEAVARALDSRALDGAALVSACFGRDQRRVRFIVGQHDLSPDIAWLVAELAAAPFAYLLQCQTFAAHHAVATVRTWDRGYCPACGSWPAVAEVTAGQRLLRCSFCAKSWGMSSYRCIYCANDSETFITAAPNPEQPGRTLQLCNACGGYLKVLELSMPTEFPLVAIEDLASMDLDMVAIERKYMRPALPEIKRR